MDISTITTEQGTSIVHPTTGEVIPLADLTIEQIAEHVIELEDLLLTITDVHDALVAEGASRLDRLNARKHQADGFEIATNAATTERYEVAPTRQALTILIDEGILDASVLEKVITTPPPVDPVPRVDKRELNKLKRHPNPMVAAQLGAARDLQPQRRTFKVTRRPA